MQKIKTAFSLAEITAVLVFLGIVIALVLPGAYNNAVIKSNRLKLRKASSVYQQLVERIIVENDLPRSAQYLDSFATADNCRIIRVYFRVESKVSKTCRFKTKSGLNWDFNPDSGYGLTKALISFDDKYLNGNEAESDNYNAFFMTSSFSNDGALHINDTGYEEKLKSDNFWYTKKIDCFINGKVCKAEDYRVKKQVKQ